MEFVCQDLAGAGVVLIPPSSPEYAQMVDDIDHRLANPVPGAPSRPPHVRGTLDRLDPIAAVLVNRSTKSIAAWSVVWKFEEANGRKYRHATTTAAGGNSVLIPFGLTEQQRALQGYWSVILPGSKRWISRLAASRASSTIAALRRRPSSLRSSERSRVPSHSRPGRHSRVMRAHLWSGMDRMRSSVSTQIDRIRQMRGDEQAVYMLLEWHATAVPDYRRRP